MKKSYLLFKNLLPKYWQKTTKVFGFVLFLGLLTQFGFAQTTINWTGAVSTDANAPINWEPQQTPYDNIISIDSAYKFKYLPVLNVESTSAINEIIKGYTSWLEINVAADQKLDINGKNKHLFPHGKLYKTGEGLLTFRANVYCREVEDTIIVSEGKFEVRAALLMGNASEATVGGYLFINGTGNVHLRGAPSRFTYPDVSMSHITITDEGTLTVVGDFSEIADSLAYTTEQIRSTPDRDIVIEFDPLQNLTTIYSRDKMAFLIENGETQNLTAGEDGDTLKIIENDGLASMNSLDWRYSNTSGSGYVSFDPAKDVSKLVPNFETPGVYYLVCVGNNGTTTDTTNEVKIIVSSNKVHVSPDGLQVMKVGQKIVPLIVTEDEEASSREWLYTTIPGENYQSFDPAITDTFCAPIFDEVGEYYISCRSVIGTINEQSADVQINVVDTTTRADLRWKGTVDTDASNPLNWFPHAYLYRNNTIFDTSEYTINEPVLSSAGHDTIGKIDIREGATFTIDKPEGDSVIRTGSDADWLFGTLYIKSGVFRDNVYFHLKDKTGVIDISGGTFSTYYPLLLGNGNPATAGGYLNIHGTGIVDVPVLDRFCATDSTQSVVTIWDEGKLIMHGDYETEAKVWAASNQLKSLEYWELVITLNKTATDTTTIVTAYDPNAISISPTGQQTLAIDEAATTLTASNTGIYDSLIWKYSTNVGGELIAFEPAINETTASPSFSETGTYYVVCIGMNDTITKKSNSVQIVVPDVFVTPADKQVALINVSDIELSVTDSPEANSISWKISEVQGGPYQDPDVPAILRSYNPIFENIGTYYLICEATYGVKVISSNEVEVVTVDLDIAPTASQNIHLDTDGNTITVTETGTVDSREWMYTTTSGEDYTSFDPAETSTEYTPNFATEGTYYVVCAPVFSGVTKYSEEVTITVEGISGINNTELNSLAVYPNPTTGNFRIQEEINGKYRVDVYNSQGKMVLSEEYNGLEGLQEFSLDNKGIYVINLVTHDFIKTTKLIVE